VVVQLIARLQILALHVLPLLHFNLNLRRRLWLGVRRLSGEAEVWWGWFTGALAGMGEGQVCEELLLEVLHLHLQLQPLLDVLLALAGVEALQALRLSVHDAELGLVALYGLAEEPVLPLQDVVA
jgi:hypothetical protein